MKGEEGAVLSLALDLQLWPNWQPQIPATSNMPFLWWRQPVLGVLIISQMTARPCQNHAGKKKKKEKRMYLHSQYGILNRLPVTRKETFCRNEKERDMLERAESYQEDTGGGGKQGWGGNKPSPESVRTCEWQNTRKRGNPSLGAEASCAKDCCSPRWAAVTKTR